jgi:hypothetical protein
MLTNPIAPPKVPATRLKNVVRSDAPDTRRLPHETPRPARKKSIPSRPFSLVLEGDAPIASDDAMTAL